MKAFALSAAIVFLVLAIVHAIRIWLGWPVSVGSIEIPMWPSAVFIVASLILCFGLFRQALASQSDRLTLEDLRNLLRLNMQIQLSEHLLKHAFPPSLENESARLKCKAFAAANHCKVSFDDTFKTAHFQRLT